VVLTLVAACVSVAACATVRLSARRMTGNPWACPWFAEEFAGWVERSVEARTDAGADGTTGLDLAGLERVVAALTAPVAEQRRSPIAA
jgi:hypothetical protein